MSDWKALFRKYFLEGNKYDANSLLGVEVEHFIIDVESNTAVPYSGEAGVQQILKRLINYYPDAKVLDDDDFFGFSVKDFTITLEPAAQLEISIAPAKEIIDIGKIYQDFRRNLDDVLDEYGYMAVNTGCQPVSRVEDLKLIPKRRYYLMNEYFHSTGSGGIEMMRGTASLQISVDYSSEEDFRKKIQAAYYYGPVLKLLCDNSYSFQGESLETYLKRTDIWNRVDPSRCGIIPGVFSENFGFNDYSDYIGNTKPIFLKCGHDIIPTDEKTVDEIMVSGDPSGEEIEHILSMVFPDVRLKHVLEIRFADSVCLPFVLAYCALIKGLIYSDEGIEYSQSRIVADSISEVSVLNAEKDIMKYGWQACVYGRPVSDFAEEIITIARRNISDEEKAFLNPFSAVVEYGGISKIPEEVYSDYLNVFCK